jgi:asparagine synthase (glutamine-hydrolysing)
MSSDFADRLPARGAWGERDIRPIPDPRKFMGKILMRGHLATRMTSWASWGARIGLQYRYPLLDRRVLEFVLSLPPEVFHGPGEGRHLARKALAAYLPPKTNKHDPANERMRAQARMECWKALASDLPLKGAPERHRWLDTDSLQKQIDDVPEKIGVPEILTFAEVCSAVRIWYLDRRTRRSPPRLREENHPPPNGTPARDSRVTEPRLR